MARFGTREEYEAWKAAGGGKTAAPVKDTAPAPKGGFSVANRKARLGLVIASAAVMIGASGFLYLSGDAFSGTFVIVLGALILGLYVRFKLRPEFSDHLSTVRPLHLLHAGQRSDSAPGTY